MAGLKAGHGSKHKKVCRRNPLQVKDKEGGAPNGTILELFCRYLCQPCHRSNFQLMWELKQRINLPQSGVLVR